MLPDPVAAPLDAARALAPQVAACADAIERERRLPDALVAALCEAGLFRMLLPASVAAVGALGALGYRRRQRNAS